MLGFLFMPFLPVAVVAARTVAPARDTERPLRTIAVEINGTPLETDTPPIVVNGRVLVPMREVFDALGIVVTRAGGTISARLPTSTVTFSVGSSYAHVDDRSVALDAAPVDRKGTLYAPLQLLVAAFGAQASYDGRAAQVLIVSDFVGRESAAERQRAGGGSDVQGVVSAIDQDSEPPEITVVRGGTSRTVAVTSDAKVWIEDVSIRSQVRGAVGDLRVGDAVHAILASDGRVISVFDFYKSTVGTITAIASTALVLENGRVVSPTAKTEISLNDAAATLGDLHVGDFVTVRSNPESGELRAVVASRTVAQGATAAPTAAGASAQIASVDISATRPLRAGETLDVVMHGTSGGRASFDIGDSLVGLPMDEHAAGTYSGRFTVPDHFNVTQVPIFAHLSVGSSDAPRLQAALAFSAATIPPAVGEIAPPSGEIVNNVRPSIFATYSAPTGIAINQSSVTLSVNGHDYTSDAVRSGGFITYSPGIDLPGGPVTVVVRVADAAGNVATRSWTFSIKARP